MSASLPSMNVARRLLNRNLQPRQLSSIQLSSQSSSSTRVTLSSSLCSRAPFTSTLTLTNTIKSRNFSTPPPPASTLTDEELRKRLEDFQSLFVEARLSIEDVQDSIDTTYYDEDVEVAMENVAEAVKNFEGILAELDAEKRTQVMRGNGLKVEQLKGELKLVLDGGH